MKRKVVGDAVAFAKKPHKETRKSEVWDERVFKDNVWGATVLFSTLEGLCGDLIKNFRTL